MKVINIILLSVLAIVGCSSMSVSEKETKRAELDEMAATEGSSGALNEGYTVHVLSDGGASATATARVIRIKINSELTDDD